MQRNLLLLFCGLFMLKTGVLGAEIRLHSAQGGDLILQKPAARIVSLSPHLTENLFAVGAGSKLVGAVDYSDYPPAAQQVPRVGSYDRVDLERIVALKPDLVLAWHTGNSPASLEKLRALGIPVWATEPGDIAAIADQLEQLGRMAGTARTAKIAAQDFRKRLAKIQRQAAAKPKVRVFYQVWKSPLMTVAGPQLISQAIELCRGKNVFASLAGLSPTVSIEAVLAERPQVIVASGMDTERPEWLDDWRQWKSIPAAAGGHLYFIPPHLLQRHTPRLLEGLEQLCEFIDRARL